MKSIWATVILPINSDTRWAIDWLESNHGHDWACADAGMVAIIVAAIATTTAVTPKRRRPEAPHLDRETDRRSRVRCMPRLPQRSAWTGSRSRTGNLPQRVGALAYGSGARLRLDGELSEGLQLGNRDSNPNFDVQSVACCHYTIPQCCAWLLRLR